MTEITLVSFGLNILYYIVAVAVMFYTLRLYDYLGGGKFSEVKAVLKSDPKACAIYYGARILAVALLGAAFAG